MFDKETIIMARKEVTGYEAGVLVEAPANNIASKWALDGSHSSVGFSVKHMMVSNVRGEFRDVRGSLTLASPIEDSVVEIDIRPSSIDTRDVARDEHLRSADFFD